MTEKLVLALDGSTSVCSAALLRGVGSTKHQGWEVTAKRAEANGLGQARVLLRSADEMLAETGSRPEDLGAVVVGIGPGTFTGVRIAVATARGLAVGLRIPVFGVDSLSALAVGALAKASTEEIDAWSRVVAVIDARRQQVFFAAYQKREAVRRGQRPQWERSLRIEVGDRDSLGARSGPYGAGSTVVVGQDAELVDGLSAGARFIACEVEAEYLVACRELIGEKTVGHGGRMSGEGSLGGEADGTPESVKPIYVRAPDADVHITKMKDPWADGS